MEDVLNQTDDTLRPFTGLADKYGLSPETIHAQVAQVKQAFANQARAVIQSQGVDSEEVIKFANEFYPRDQLKEWQRQHYIKGDTRYLSQIITAFKTRRGIA